MRMEKGRGPGYWNPKGRAPFGAFYVVWEESPASGEPRLYQLLEIFVSAGLVLFHQLLDLIRGI